jgi:4-amino-4-deoxy-L-arabinose transferase-like glycosyltransferase
MRGLRPLAWRPLLVVFAGQAALLLATANRYGYHRDELYFRVAGRHLQSGYPDQPPLTPLLGRVSEALFGETPRGLRVVSVLAMVACALLAALIARELGGGAAAQTVAAAAFAASGYALAVGHLLSTSTFDVLAWAALSWLFVRLLRTGDQRLWLLLGLTSGVGLLNKHLVLLFWASIAAGILASRRLGLLRSRYVPAGAAVALALWAPNVVWQARHDWPQLTLARQIADEDPTGNRIALLPLQAILLGPVVLLLAVVGLRLLARDERLARFRPLVWAYPFLLVVTLLLGAKFYYPAGMFALLCGAGGLAAERWLARGGARRVALLAAGIAVWFVPSLPLVLPILPTSQLADSPVPDVNEDAIETVGWPGFVRQVAAVRARVPDAVVFAGSYGEAGAIYRYGPALGIDRVYSGHNGFADWEKPPDFARDAVVVGFFDEHSHAYLRGLCTSVTLAGRIDNGVGLDNEEQGGPIYVCRGMRRSWSEEWPRLRHLDA